MYKGVLSCKLIFMLATNPAKFIKLIEEIDEEGTAKEYNILNDNDSTNVEVKSLLEIGQVPENKID